MMRVNAAKPESSAAKVHMMRVNAANPRVYAAKRAESETEHGLTSPRILPAL